jgi:hypothetical protein
MSADTVDRLIWAYLYAGLLLLSLGYFVHRSSPVAGWAIAGVGVVLALLGALLVWVRSRMKS